MKKILIGILIFIFLTPAAFAADEKAVEQLSLEQAVQLALGYSYAVKNSSLAISQAQELRDQARDVVDYTDSAGQIDLANPSNYNYAGSLVPDYQSKSALLGLVQADINLSMSKRQEDLNTQTIAYMTKKSYDDLAVALNNQINAQQATMLAEKRFALASTRKDLGLDSDFSLEQLREDVKQTKDQQVIAAKAVETAYANLNNLVGYTMSKRYEIDAQTTYAAIAFTDIEQHAAVKIGNDPYIWLQGQGVNLAQRSLSLYTSRGIDKPYDYRVSEVAKQKNKLQVMKDKLTLTVKTRYDKLHQLEEQIKITESKLQKAQAALKLTQLQNQLGMAIAIDVESAEVAVSSLQLELKNLKLQHEDLNIVFEKPYLYPEYATS